MKTIRFELNGVLMAMDFKDNIDIENKTEKMIRNEVLTIENTYDCNIINDILVDDVLETAIPDDEVEEGFVERHIAYKLEVEKRISSSLGKNKILDLIKYLDENIQRDLSLKLGALEFNPEEVEWDEDFEYEYDIVSESLLFSEVEFVNTICENMSNPNIEKLSLEIAGFDYTENTLNIEDVMSNRYKELNEYQIINFAKKILIELEKNSDTKYYEISFYYNKPTKESLDIYGECGFSYYFKTHLDLSAGEILDKTLKYMPYKEFENTYTATYHLDNILEITSDEFYTSTY